MKTINELKKILNKNFDWNKSRLDCFARLLLSLFKSKTVNLKQIALGFESDKAVDSRYRRLQRFFAEFKFDYAQLAQWFFKWFFSKQKKVYLILDRTNWWFGRKKINILLLSVAYEGLSIPLLWDLLDKAGNASATQHQAIIQRYIDIFGQENILGILGDREFASGQLFGWLKAQRLPFYIRIKSGISVKINKKKVFTAEALFTQVNPKCCKVFGMGANVLDQSVYLTGARSERDELMIIATNADYKAAVSIYLRRWEIENLFQSLKSRGFCLEDTHLTHPERISKLMAVLSIAFCWAHKVGEWQALKKPIIFKHFKNQQRPQYTYFRYGLDLMRNILFNTNTLHKKLFNQLLALFPTSTAEALS